MKARLVYLIFVPLLFISCGLKKSMEFEPDISGIEKIDTTRIQHSENHYSLGKNQLYKNEFGIWELYLEGDALERGLANGSLSRELIRHQEQVFMQRLSEMVPSENYRSFLLKSVSFFNRKMYQYIPQEYLKEIYGVSRYASAEFNEFAPAFTRMLYLHGAHDIGHAMQDLMLVGCTSFAAWDEQTADGQLLLGRNFDFYAGDEFAEQKIAAFINPDKGHKFMMYTWGGMIGVVSGMNEQGLSVTINAGRSGIPLVAKTPVSLVAREILQYASSTQEAIEIARKREVFVSEAIMVGSAKERNAILIEVSPRNFGVYEVDNSSQLICSNHFQSEAYSEDRRNKKAILESHTQYRYERMQQLLAEEQKLEPGTAVSILRNMEGKNEAELGYGNELAINQLLAHHAIVFKPEENRLWVSTGPYQMGEFVAYDLDSAFEKFTNGIVGNSVASKEWNIPESDFIHQAQFKNYERYRKLEYDVKAALRRDEIPEVVEAEELVKLNPQFWEAWYLAGMVYYEQEDYDQALRHFEEARQKEITTLPDEEELEKMIKRTQRKL
ncbi:C45 family autoproteolytic acyltransferase/hydrolase [Gramella sp. GC03-9]|uniref:C45 family autoproteolytic acyltransferase/hydrolase n=2 Tax=Christiangramia oceanisediminis TaxID=2920386 RepID=A0A9X2KYL8_9FLAO|nr:C45 family autoproteolytic acyltransferase/hydolase [Gramella oceanisediminis]MCP9200461.1 C45 family autoproteolytic acyltransferase/hydrolase [Gramella oceanisediminis]